MYEHFYAVIMAGGSGTRLWPLSRQARPKHMLSLLEERSLFQVSVARVKDIIPADRIYVVTVQAQAGELRAQCPEVPLENFLIEPMPRGTASVIGLGAVAMRRRDPQAVMAVLTSDHYIGNETCFRDLLSSAYSLAQQDYLVTLGIEPTFPATGFGYIQRGGSLGTFHGLEAFQVLNFKEKPSYEQAERLLESGDHSWNSGMFVWRVDRILEEFQRQMPELSATLGTISSALGTPEEQPVVQRVWPGLKNETIDYGIMEGASQVAVIPAAGLSWNDVGSWDSLFEVLKGDTDGNIVMGGEHVGLDTRKSLIYMNQPRRLIVTIGVEDLVVVDTGDVLLVCQKDQAQRVRQVVAQLKERGQEFV